MRLVALLLAALLGAGCLGDVQDRLRASDVLAPEYEVGDWWTYRVRSPFYGVEESEVTVVVANESAAGYTLGHAATGNASGEGALLALLFHMPALGPVTDALAYDVHGTRFEPVRFPLEEGLAWDTTWVASEVALTARLVNGTWRINNSGEETTGGLTYELEYDPAQRALSRFARIDAAGVVRQEIELVASGTGFVGEVVAPGSIEVVLLESRSTGSLSGGMPASPQPSFSPPEGVDTLLVACIAGGAPGQYQAEVRNAQGVVCQVEETVPPGNSGFGLQVVEAPADVEGWGARLAAGGTGSATVEVLGYASRVVTLGNATADAATR